MIAILILLSLLVVATLTDLKDHKIYNWTTLPGIVLALLLAFLATATGSSALATVGIWESFFGLAACGGVMLICFICFQIGGGDVKLLAMVGAFMGPQFGIQVLLWTFVLGAIAGVFLLARNLGVFEFVKRLAWQLYSRVRLGYWQPVTEREHQQLKIRFYLAPYALLAFGVVGLGSMPNEFGQGFLGQFRLRGS